MRIIPLALLALSALSLVASTTLGAEVAPAPKDPPGVVIDASPDFIGVHIGSPSIEILADGTYVASHDFFGASPNCDHSTHLFESTDKGSTWREIATLPRQKGSYLFRIGATLYCFGWEPGEGFVDPYKNTKARVELRRSTDGGHTWSRPLDSKSGILIGGTDGLSIFCDPAPVLIHNGRVWKEVEQLWDMDPESKPRNWSTQFRPMCASAPVDSDLLDSANWTFSAPVPWIRQVGLGGWCEGNVLSAPDGSMLIQMRVDDAVNDGKAAQIRVSSDGTSATWDPETGFVEMPGGCKKFVIKYDEPSKKYWALVNWIHPDDVDAPNKERTRNTLALVCSSDLKTWEIRTIVFRRLDLTKGFQYCDWRVEGEDMIFVCRLAWDGAPNCHDANYFTFHRLKNFRNLTRDDDAPTWR